MYLYYFIILCWKLHTKLLERKRNECKFGAGGVSVLHGGGEAATSDETTKDKRKKKWKRKEWNSNDFSFCSLLITCVTRINYIYYNA